MARPGLRLDTLLLAGFVCGWLVALGLLVAGAPLAGHLDLTLYQFYGVAAFAGWLLGNLYVYRSRTVLPPARRFLMLIYLFGPPGLLYLLRSLAASSAQQAIPLAPVYASVVYAILFLVPVTLRVR